MYHTPVDQEAPADGLVAVDEGLLRLRRLWSASRSRLVDDVGAGSVEMSSLLVVEACARGAAAGLEVGVRDVARLADVEPSTASRLVDRAQEAGLVVRAASQRSARRTAVHLTPAGAALRGRAVAARRGWLADVLAGWDAGDVDVLGALLGRFADAMDAGRLSPGANSAASRGRSPRRPPGA